MGKRSWWLAAILVAGLVIGFAANAMAGDATQASAPTPARTITVTSTASVGTAPDEAVVEFGIRSEAPDGPTAYAQNSTKSGAVVTALKDAGLAAGDIETTNVNLDRVTKQRNTPQETTVYAATTELTATVRPTDRVADVISAAVSAGADSVRGLRFQVGDETAARQDALTAAVKGARRKADAIAAAAGASVSAVVQVREEGSNAQPYYYRGDLVADSFAAPAAAPYIAAPKTVSTEVTVTVIWSIA
jgi:uncharacterized protein YggE